ncbi:hypothetical protein RHGRI_006150 [Rhododendron griersonianum]|uniref:Uncharacterized protein n=1 Tax=Rhododendron griersonianum TaxID=479676 RepID=A0AAV6LHI3_9ERIC|nr:hypothetical protein RHGRI_006150 [Rhododendron griersonianum]
MRRLHTAPSSPPPLTDLSTTAFFGVDKEIDFQACSWSWISWIPSQSLFVLELSSYLENDGGDGNSRDRDLELGETKEKPKLPPVMEEKLPGEWVGSGSGGGEISEAEGGEARTVWSTWSKPKVSIAGRGFGPEFKTGWTANFAMQTSKRQALLPCDCKFLPDFYVYFEIVPVPR